MSATLQPTHTLRVPGTPEVRAVETAPADPAEREMRRWLIGLGTPFVLGAVFFALSIGTSAHWLLGVSLALGPVLFLLATVYLCLSTDTNGAPELHAVANEPGVTVIEEAERAAA